MSLYLYQNNQQTGPFTEEQIRQMLLSGSVNADTLAWRQGMAGWEPLATFPSLSASGLPPAPPVGKSPLGLISLIMGIVCLLGWVILLVVAGVAHNEGYATETFNMVVGLLLFAGLFVNAIAVILGVIGAFKSSSNTLAIVGACVNGLEIIGLIALVILGLAVKQGAHL